MQSQEEGAGRVRRGHGTKHALPRHGGSAGGQAGWGRQAGRGAARGSVSSCPGALRVPPRECQPPSLQVRVFLLY